MTYKTFRRICTAILISLALCLEVKAQNVPVYGNLVPSDSGALDLGRPSLHWDTIFVNTIIPAVGSSDYSPWDTTATAIIQKDTTLNLGIGTTTPGGRIVAYDGTNFFFFDEGIFSAGDTNDVYSVSLNPNTFTAKNDIANVHNWVQLNSADSTNIYLEVGQEAFNGTHYAETHYMTNKATVIGTITQIADTVINNGFSTFKKTAFFTNGTTSQGKILMFEDLDNGSNSATLQSPASLAADYTLTFPADDGTANQTLQTNGTGTLSWISAFTGNGTDVFLTDSGDSVGIGTNTPIAKLQVVGTSIFQWDITGGTGAIGNDALGTEINLSGTYGQPSIHLRDSIIRIFWANQANDTSAHFFNNTKGDWIFQTEVNDGNIGIGTISPLYKLHVAGKGFFSDSLITEHVAPADSAVYNIGTGNFRYSDSYINSMTTYSIIDEGSTVNTTAGDGATINAMSGRFRKDTSGAVFTLANSYVTANSIVVVTPANAAIDATATTWTVDVSGGNNIVVTFDAAPSANFDMNFIVIN